MDEINQLNLTLGIINGIWGILNIGITIGGVFYKLMNKKLLDRIKSDKDTALNERTRECKNCKSAHNKAIKVLMESNDKLIEKVGG